MRRRDVLAGLSALTALPTAGCLGDAAGPCADPWEPIVDADTATLRVGEAATISIAVSSVVGLQVRGLPLHDDEDALAVTTFDVAPEPDAQADVSPPQWYWDACTDPTVTIRIVADAAADPRTIEYTVHLVQSRDRTGETADRTRSLTITDG